MFCRTVLRVVLCYDSHRDLQLYINPLSLPDPTCVNHQPCFGPLRILIVRKAASLTHHHGLIWFIFCGSHRIYPISTVQIFLPPKLEAVMTKKASLWRHMYFKLCIEEMRSTRKVRGGQRRE